METMENLRDRLEALEKQTSVSGGVAYKGIQEEPWEMNISFAKVVVRAAIVLVLSVATVLLAPSPSWAQVRLFVRFDQLGSCGGSTVSVFQGFIEARSVQLLLSQQVTNPSGGSRPSGTDDIVGIQIVQPPGECSPQLFLQSLSGGLLTFRASFTQVVGGQEFFVPLEIVATEVGITRIEMGSTAGQAIQELVTLGINGGLMVTTRTPSPTAPPLVLSQCWDFASNRAC